MRGHLSSVHGIWNQLGTRLCYTMVPGTSYIPWTGPRSHESSLYQRPSFIAIGKAEVYPAEFIIILEENLLFLTQIALQCM